MLVGETERVFSQEFDEMFCTAASRAPAGSGRHMRGELRRRTALIPLRRPVLTSLQHYYYFFSSIPSAEEIVPVPFSAILKAKLLFEPWRKQAQVQMFPQVTGLSPLCLNSCISSDRSTQTLALLAVSLLKCESPNVMVFHT